MKAESSLRIMDIMSRSDSFFMPPYEKYQTLTNTYIFQDVVESTVTFFDNSDLCSISLPVLVSQFL